METRVLKVFCAVAESGNLVAAARKVHLTPSAISHSIKSLETDLGMQLFERVGKRMVLNHAGEQLLAQVESPLAALDSAAEAIRHLGKWGQSRLRIGATHTSCEHILPGVIRELKRTQLAIELRVESGDTPQLIDMLHESKVDVALGMTPSNPTGLTLFPIFRDELMFVFSPTHPWMDGRPITSEEIRRQQFILYQRSSLTSQMLEGYFRRLHIIPGAAMEMGSTAAILAMVKLGLGVSVMSPWTLGQELARGALKMRPLGSRPLYRRWSLMTLAARRMSLAEETFCRLCRNHSTGMRLDRNDLPPLKTGVSRRAQENEQPA